MVDERIAGKLYKLSEGQVKALDPVLDAIDNSIAAFNESSRQIKAQRREMWRTLYEMFPELSGYHLNYDRSSHSVVIVRRKIESEMAE